MNESQERLQEARQYVTDVSGPINFLKWWRDGIPTIMFMEDCDAEEGRTFTERCIFDEPNGVKAWLDSLLEDGRLGNAVTLLDTVAHRGPAFTFGLRPAANGTHYILTVRW